MLKGLITFQTDYPESQAILLYRGNERLLINNILCLPCEQFLKSLVPGQLLNPTGNGLFSGPSPPTEAVEYSGRENKS